MVCGAFHILSFLMSCNGALCSGEHFLKLGKVGSQQAPENL
jgi:hypothetical protein